jgi:hypothetical protein
MTWFIAIGGDCAPGPWQAHRGTSGKGHHGDTGTGSSDRGHDPSRPRPRAGNSCHQL